MATELVMAGPGKPVSHTASHDLESLFYVLLGICVLFDEPHRLKPKNALASCFDLYFNTFEPSLLKTITIQSQLGWSRNILPHISPYFQPLVSLLETLREMIILPMEFKDNSYQSGSPITHDKMIKVFLKTLCDIDDQCWVRRMQPNKDPLPVRDAEPQTRSDAPSDASEPECSESDGSSEDANHAIHATPRMPRPSSIRPVSGPGFTSSTSSGGTRRQLSDDGDYIDPDSRASKRSRPAANLCFGDPRPTGPVTR